MEEILPKESTPNLEERGWSVHTDGREQGAFIWQTKLSYTQENISWLYSGLALIKAAATWANLAVQIKPV